MYTRQAQVDARLVRWGSGGAVVGADIGQNEPHQHGGLRGLAPAVLRHPQLPPEAAEQGQRGLRGRERRRRFGASGNYAVSI